MSRNQGVDFAVLDQFLQGSPAVNVLAVDKDLRDEISVVAELFHALSVFRVGPVIGLLVPADFTAGVFDAPSAEILFGFFAGAAQR